MRIRMFDPKQMSDLDEATIPDRDWFKFIERKGHFFDFLAFAHADSYMLLQAVGFGFPESLYRFQNGQGSNYRDRKMFDAANSYFLSLIAGNNACLAECTKKGEEIRKRTDSILVHLNTSDAGHMLEPGAFGKYFSLLLESFLYECTIPFLCLEAAEYAKSTGQWRDEYQEYIRPMELLRAESNYLDLEEAISSYYSGLAGARMNLSDSSLARFLTPSEIERILSGELAVSEDELKSRSVWCVFWTDDGGKNFHFVYDREISKRYPFLNESVAEMVSEFSGSVAHRGIVRGTIHVVNEKEDMKGFRNGMILVSQSTNPVLMPVIVQCSAIVTDEGGIASHAAISARELKKPCIIGTENATRILRDGDLVEVDADNGVVRVVKRA